MARTKPTAEEYNANRQQGIVDKIVALMDSGKLPWRKPWVGTPYLNPLTKAEYKGRNPLYLSVDVADHEYSSPLFMGASQARAWGWFPKKGSKATWIKQGMSDRKEEDGKVEQRRFFTKWVGVFNLDALQEGNDPLHTVEEIKALYQVNPTDQLGQIPLVESFIAAQQVSTHFMGDQACYCSTTDKISMPHRESFTDLVSFYATWIHEHGHSTGHQSRLKRDLSNSFGSRAYAYEELIAELCACLTCDRLGIAPDLTHHASYLQSWLAALKDDKTFFFKAVAQAGQASTFLFDQFTKASGNPLPAEAPAETPSVHVPCEVG